MKRSISILAVAVTVFLLSTVVFLRRREPAVKAAPLPL